MFRVQEGHVALVEVWQLGPGDYAGVGVECEDLEGKL